MPVSILRQMKALAYDVFEDWKTFNHGETADRCEIAISLSTDEDEETPSRGWILLERLPPAAAG